MLTHPEGWLRIQIGCARAEQFASYDEIGVSEEFERELRLSGDRLRDLAVAKRQGEPYDQAELDQAIRDWGRKSRRNQVVRAARTQAVYARNEAVVARSFALLFPLFDAVPGLVVDRDATGHLSDHVSQTQCWAHATANAIIELAAEPAVLRLDPAYLRAWQMGSIQNPLP